MGFLGIGGGGSGCRGRDGLLWCVWQVWQKELGRTYRIQVGDQALIGGRRESQMEQGRTCCIDLRGRRAWRGAKGPGMGFRGSCVGQDLLYSGRGEGSGEGAGGEEGKWGLKCGAFVGGCGKRR